MKHLWYCILIAVCFLCGCSVSHEQEGAGLSVDAISKTWESSASFEWEQMENRTPAAQEAAKTDNGTFYVLQDGSPSVLLWDGTQAVFFDWNAVTPRGVDLQAVPAPWNPEQTAVVFLSGTGTGISVYELHVVERLADGTGYREYVLPPDAGQAAIMEDLAVKRRGSTLRLQIGAQELTLSLPEELPDAELAPGGLHYEMGAQGIQLAAEFDWVSPSTNVTLPAMTVTARVQLEKEQFLLDAITLAEDF